MKISYEDEKLVRLDMFLVEKYPEVSRSQMQKLIKNGDIVVNDKKVLPHHFLKTGVEIKLPDILADKVKQKVVIKKLVPNTDIKLDIIDETDDYLVVNKPAGLLIHPTHKNEDDTLTNALLAYFPDVITVGDLVEGKVNQRPGIVHRLDKNVSGLVVVAKNQEMFFHLKKQFQNREVKKEYLALVYGTMNDNSGLIDFSIGISKKSGKMAARPKSTEIESKSAITLYEVVKKFQQYTLIKVQIKTGRTHQIRVHLSATDHSVVGDDTYRTRKLKSRIKLDRIFLHAFILGFVDLNNNWQEFESVLPESLNKFTKTLKLL